MSPIQLKGLPGLNRISEEERNKFLLTNADKLKKYEGDEDAYNQAAEVLYNNRLFKSVFGDAGFQAAKANGIDYEKRNEILRNKVIKDAFVDNFKDDKDFDLLSSELDEQGMYDLMTNGNYIGSKEREKRLAAGIKASKSVAKDFDTAAQSPFTDALGAGFMQIGKASAAESPYERDKKYENNDKDIREKLFADSQKRREEEISDLTNSIYGSMLTSDSSGQKSIAQFYDEFDKLATKNSPHYATFKNSKWLKNYTHDDRLREYAKYLALKEAYGETVALKYLDRNIQDTVAKAQDGEWTGNTLKGVGTTVWSDLGSNYALLRNIGKSPEEIGILNQGKDPNKPIYDKNGKIVDYEENKDWSTNPAYWNDVYKYNTYSPSEIKAIKERGGISEDVNVREYGYKPNFFSWDTAEEGFKQSGHIISGIIETGLTGTAGKAAGWSIKGALKAAGMTAKALNKAAKVGNITNDLFVMATTGLEGAQLEAMGTFDEQMQAAREKVQDQIKNELREYQRSIDYDSPEAKQAINSYYQKLKREDNNRLARNQREGISQLPKSDELLMNQAMQEYTNQLLSDKNKELEEYHQKDMLEAARAATKAYGANFIMDYIKNVPITTGIQKFKIAKGATTGALDNYLAKNIIGDVTTGGVKRTTKNLLSAKNLAKELGKQLGGGFADEYLDGINASFASGIGNNDFDNYIRRNYDPEAYNAVVDNMLGNMLAGLNEGTRGITDRQNLYEGFIGMVSPVTSVSLNPNALFTPKDTWKAVMSGESATGRQLNYAERLSNLLMNPLLDTYSRLKEEDSNIDAAVENINTVVANNKDKLEDASKVVAALKDYSSALVESPTSGLLDSKDSKLNNAFTLINALNTLETIGQGSSAKLYQDAIHTLKGLAEGTLSEDELNEEIDMFLADPDNKSILDQINAREIAAERLQKNAKYFMGMKDKVQEIEELFAKTPNLRNIDPRIQSILTHNLVASDDYKQRLKEIEEDLSLSSTDADSMYSPDLSARYGTSAARVRAASARDRILKDIEKAQKEALDNENKANVEAEKLKLQIKSTTGDTSELREKLSQQNNLAESARFNWTTLEDRKRMVQEELSNLQSNAESGNSETEFTEDYILSLDARDRAEVLNPNNKSNYSKKQQDVINHTVNNLLRKDPDAIRKIMDAGVLANRINDLKTVYSRILDNNALAATYLNAVRSVRNGEAMAESLQRGIEEHYGNIEDAYQKLSEEGDNPDTRAALKSAIINTNSAVINAYIEDHPEQTNLVKPYLELLEFEEDAKGVILRGDISQADKITLLNTLQNVEKSVHGGEEAKEYLEGIIDSSDVNEHVKEIVDNFLTEMDKIGHLRNATVVETRKERKAREAEEKAKREEEKKQLEEADKAAAAEAALKAEEAARKANEGDVEVQELSEEIPLQSDEESPEEVQEVKEEKEEKSQEEENKSEEKEDKSEKGNNFTSTLKNVYIKESGDDVYIESKNIEEQANETSNGGKEVSVSEVHIDVSDLNSTGQHKEEKSTTTLSANAVPEWVVDKDRENANLRRKNPRLKKADEYQNDLMEDGALVHRKGAEGTVNMDNYFNWMKAEGIHLQNIIDTELGLILKRNPKAKFKFMSVRSVYNATNDNNMRSHLLLVLDYDNSINKGIKSIHNNANGGVIKTNGKEYLVVGVVGYGSQENKGRKDLYDILYSNDPKGPNGIGLVKRGMKAFYDEHPSERFYVPEDLSTEVVPNSLIPGWIIKQLESDENPQYRSISELLSDSERNPNGETIESLAWGIQQLSKFVTVGVKAEDVMSPRRRVENAGNAFILIPASNGKYLASYLRPLFYNEMRDGKLKDEVNRLLENLTSLDYATRLDAINGLTNIFYFDKDGDFILTTKNKKGKAPVVSLVHNGGDPFAKFTLDSSFDRNAFLQAVSDMNPRVNITVSVLQSPTMLEQYDEAGALTTDIAKLATAGASYEIYPVDAEGNMIVPEVPVNDTSNTTVKDDFRNEGRPQVVYNHQFYVYDKAEGKYYLNGIPISDNNLIQQLDYNRRLIDMKISPVEQTVTSATYILSEGDNPEVVIVNRNSKKITIMDTEGARDFISDLREKEAAEERRKAAEEAMKKLALESAEDVNLDFGEEGNPWDVSEEQETQQEEKEEIEEKEEKKEEEVPAEQPKSETDKLRKSAAELGGSAPSGTTQTFDTLAKSKKHRKSVMQLIKTKWPEHPKKMDKLVKFLREKGIEVDAIGTADADVKTWLDTVNDCY